MEPVMKNRLRGNRIAKMLSLMAALVMPMYYLVMFAVILVTGDFNSLINHYYLTFFGFYGCIMAFMGDASGPLIALLQMIIPVVPWALL